MGASIWVGTTTRWTKQSRGRTHICRKNMRMGAPTNDVWVHPAQVDITILRNQIDGYTRALFNLACWCASDHEGANTQGKGASVQVIAKEGQRTRRARAHQRKQLQRRGSEHAGQGRIGANDCEAGAANAQGKGKGASVKAITKEGQRSHRARAHQCKRLRRRGSERAGQGRISASDCEGGVANTQGKGQGRISESDCKGGAANAQGKGASAQAKEGQQTGQGRISASNCKGGAAITQGKGASVQAIAKEGLQMYRARAHQRKQRRGSKKGKGASVQVIAKEGQQTRRARAHQRKQLRSRGSKRAGQGWIGASDCKTISAAVQLGDCRGIPYMPDKVYWDSQQLEPPTGHRLGPMGLPESKKQAGPQSIWVHPFSPQDEDGSGEEGAREEGVECGSDGFHRGGDSEKGGGD
ncbi:hypothetical protein C8R44DRAFT_751397 [Mycena epipterygia]|nr:hypothetical protein C8R44DRAFT_751397 [Mycena epipterygia]